MRTKPGVSGPKPCLYWLSDEKSKKMREGMVQCDIFMAKAAGFYPVFDKMRIEDPVSGGGVLQHPGCKTCVPRYLY